MYIFLPVLLALVFAAYIAYLAIVKKQPLQAMRGMLLPGFFFLGTWGLLYYFLVW